MISYDIYFEVFGKKMKATVLAENKLRAECLLLQSIKATYVTETPPPNLSEFKDVKTGEPVAAQELKELKNLGAVIETLGDLAKIVDPQNKEGLHEAAEVGSRFQKRLKEMEEARNKNQQTIEPGDWVGIVSQKSGEVFCVTSNRCGNLTVAGPEGSTRHIDIKEVKLLRKAGRFKAGDLVRSKDKCGYVVTVYSSSPAYQVRTGQANLEYIEGKDLALILAVEQRKDPEHRENITPGT